MALYNKDYVQKVWLKMGSVAECKPFSLNEAGSVTLPSKSMNLAGRVQAMLKTKQKIMPTFSVGFEPVFFSGVNTGFIRVLNQTTLFFALKTPNETKSFFGGKRKLLNFRGENGGKQEGLLFDTERSKNPGERLNQKCLNRFNSIQST